MRGGHLPHARRGDSISAAVGTVGVRVGTPRLNRSLAANAKQAPRRSGLQTQQDLRDQRCQRFEPIIASDQ
jgi:hypothetical protein